MKQSGNILFSGVGGQGILLASELTAHAQLAAGFDVKKSEVHGMAQRGGSVEAHLRYGEKVYSPLIEPGSGSARASAHTACGTRANGLDSHARERFDAARACCSIGRARSSETTCAFGQRFCIAMLARPVPQPRSSTRCGGSRFNAGSSR